MNIPNVFLCSVPVGSRVTCNPVPLDTDEDYLCMAKPLDEMGESYLDSVLTDDGWRLGGSKPTDETTVKADEQFWSYTKGEINLIITRSPVFFTRFLAATSVSKRLNLMVKADRIALFRAVLYGNPCT